MDELKVLSRRVKMERLAKGVSQTDMANAIGTSQTNLSNMEAGRTAITIQNLFKIQKGGFFRWLWRWRTEEGRKDGR